MIIRLKKKHPKYPDLSPRQQYVVMGIEADHYRILNDQGRPYLYPPELFKVVSADQSEDWIEEKGDEGELYAYPSALNAPGFFEDYFEGDRAAVATFWRTVNRRLARAG